MAGRQPLLLLLIALLAAVPGCRGDHTEIGDDEDRVGAVREGLVEASGAEIYYKTMGSGEPIVVVHGGPGLEHTYLLPGMAELADEYRLVFYDQRGSGRSLAPLDSASITLENFLADLDAVREAQGREQMNLLGHSWGGLLSMLYASRYPDRVKSLILMSTIEPGQRYRGEISERQRRRQTADDSSAIAALVGSEAFRNRAPEAVNRLYRLSFQSSFADPNNAEELVIDFDARTAKAAGTLPALLLEPVQPFDFWNEVRKITAPTLIIHGIEDPIPVAMAREIDARIENSRLVTVENAGHFPYIEAPERTITAIRQFIAEHVRAAGGLTVGNGNGD